MVVKNLIGSRNALHTSSAIVSELSCCHRVRALTGYLDKRATSKTEKKKGGRGFSYLPGYLAHEPPEEPRPSHEGVLGVTRDRVHVLDDGLGTLALGQHCRHRFVSDERSGYNIAELEGGGTYTSPRTFDD